MGGTLYKILFFSQYNAYFCTKHLKMNWSVVKFFFITLMLIFVFSFCKKDEKPVIVNGNNHTDDSTFAVPETRDIIVYEINERAFSATSDFDGITARIDSIKALSVNVIWLMPIHPIGTVNSVNSPYSVRNYLEVNPEYGTMDDLKDLG
ncbi:MAG: hypothetical protein FJY07_13180, partial [Bacteroidetes bacterium]|nr:hypothetical protein [Bacteroidota bacterium]